MSRSRPSICPSVIPDSACAQSKPVRYADSQSLPNSGRVLISRKHPQVNVPGSLLEAGMFQAQPCLCFGFFAARFSLGAI